MDKYEQIARTVLEDACETDEIFEDYDMDLLDTGYLDSFALLEIIVSVEEAMGIKVKPTDINKEDIRTVNNFIRFLKKEGGGIADKLYL
ncbi:MAG: D-alanine--poly(phosphoribitol) ligase subunit 2 [Mobilibacterium timonense]|uniref:phosphopantetheine-binding protein n=1 Tax=Mobilibacterium timonense TaxID=1871012 RepID=UPI000985F704|nr:phosphopantetheine-binding protein [Mobilibacterium timonense]MBM6990365.1 D-alanine--poly(phosphoribitol) ligase subunit 2 [Mobilibacterium timonense]